jgi:hypothetical protein
MTREFDDPQIESMLGRLSGAYPDDNVAYAAVQGRVRQVKRRRTFVASTAACAVLLALGTFAVQGGGRSQQLSPADSFDDSTVTTDATSTSDSVDDTTDDSVDDTVDTSEAVTTVPVISLSVPESSTSGSGSSNSGSSSSSSSTSTPLADGEHTYTSDGGTITISSADGRLTLLGATAADGFEERVDQRKLEQYRVRVEFTDGDITWRIEVRTDNGRLVEKTTRHD